MDAHTSYCSTYKGEWFMLVLKNKKFRDILKIKKGEI